MNLISCYKPCLHQDDGFCALNGITCLTGAQESGCGYFHDIAESVNKKDKTGPNRAYNDINTDSRPTGAIPDRASPRFHQ